MARTGTAGVTGECKGWDDPVRRLYVGEHPVSKGLGIGDPLQAHPAKPSYPNIPFRRLSEDLDVTGHLIAEELSGRGITR